MMGDKVDTVLPYTLLELVLDVVSEVRFGVEDAIAMIEFIVALGVLTSALFVMLMLVFPDKFR